MTTRVTITNEKDSNPAQEAVVTSHNTMTEKPALTVLGPGESIDFSISSTSLLQITERTKS